MPVGFAFIMWHAPGLAGADAAGAAAQATANTPYASTNTRRTSSRCARRPLAGLLVAVNANPELVAEGKTNLEFARLLWISLRQSGSTSRTPMSASVSTRGLQLSQRRSFAARRVSRRRQALTAPRVRVSGLALPP